MDDMKFTPSKVKAVLTCACGKHFCTHNIYQPEEIDLQNLKKYLERMKKKEASNSDG